MQRQTPLDVVANYLESYQELDEAVIKELDSDIKKMDNLTLEEKKKYKDIIIQQYQNLSYRILKEEDVKNTSNIKVEIEVLDYHQTKKNCKEFFYEHQEEFINRVIQPEEVEFQKEYIEYELEELLKTENKGKYILYFSLTYDQKEWTLDYVDSSIIQKIRGLY